MPTALLDGLETYYEVHGLREDGTAVDPVLVMGGWGTFTGTDFGEVPRGIVSGGGGRTVVVDAFHKVGLNVEEQMVDWGTVVQRRPSKEPLDKGGWSMFPSVIAAPDHRDPLLANFIRSNGKEAWFGWPTDDKLEALHAQWMEVPDLAAQQLEHAVKKLGLRDLDHVHHAEGHEGGHGETKDRKSVV